MTIANLVRVTSSTIGTGTLTLGPAVVGFLTPIQAGLKDGGIYDYAIEADFVSIGDDSVPTSREVGYGTYTVSGTTLTRNVISSTNSNAALNLTGDEQVVITVTTRSFRETLQANRNYYVRTAASLVSFTNGSANITWTGHGRSVNDPIVFHMRPWRSTYTCTSANPGVFTITAGTHGFSAGSVVRFATVGNLPQNIAPNTDYYVISAGLTTTQFQVSATVGGAAINTTKLALTASSGTGGALLFTNAGNNNLVGGQIVSFSASSLPGGISASTVYYVATSPAPTATTFYVRSVADGSNIAFSSAGTSVVLEQTGGSIANGSSYLFGSNTAQHYGLWAGSLPTFSNAGLLNPGTVYYVGTVVDANTITCSTTLNNANPFGTATLATGSPEYAVNTGNDANDGLSITAPFLNLQAAADAVSKLDFNSFYVQINMADSVYVSNCVITRAYDGGGPLYIVGNETYIGNVHLNINNDNVIYIGTPLPGSLGIYGLKLSTATSGMGLSVHGLISAALIQNCEFGSIAQYDIHLAIAGCQLTINNAIVSATAGYHHFASDCNQTYYAGITAFTGVPQIVPFLCSSCSSIVVVASFLGGVDAKRYAVQLNGSINTNFAGATFIPGTTAGTTTTGGQYN